jgi:ketosteroid isomerase-like protein
MPIRDEMQVLMDRWTKGFVEGDIETCVDVYTKDAAVYSPYSEPKCGSDGIRDLFDQWHQQGETNKRVTVEDAAGDGSVAYCLVSYSGDYPQDDGSYVTESGISLNIAEKQPDGSWKLRISSMNSDKPSLAS